MKYSYLSNRFWVLILVFSSAPLVIADSKDDDEVSHNTSTKLLLADTDKHANNTNNVQLKTKPAVELRPTSRHGYEKFNEDEIKFEIGDRLNFSCEGNYIPSGSYWNLIQIKGTTAISRFSLHSTSVNNMLVIWDLYSIILGKSDDGTIIYCHIKYMENNGFHGFITSKLLRLVLKSKKLPETVNPCSPSPCGPNSQCKEVNQMPSCSCLKGYHGQTPYCKPECSSNEECSTHLSCINMKCKNPCTGACGVNAECRVVSHTPFCSCSYGYTFVYPTNSPEPGDPSFSCVQAKSQSEPNSSSCSPSPCGVNAVCKERNNAGSCDCVDGYIGDPFEACRLECLVNTDCPSNRTCVNNKCVDRCLGRCASNSECEEVDNARLCVCIGYSGEPIGYCVNQDMDHDFTHNNSRPSSDKGEHATNTYHEEDSDFISKLASSGCIVYLLYIAVSIIVVPLIIIIRRRRARKVLQKENEATLPEYEEIPIMLFNEARNLLVSNTKISSKSSAPAPAPAHSPASQSDDHYSYAYGIRPEDDIKFDIL